MLICASGTCCIGKQLRIICTGTLEALCYKNCEEMYEINGKNVYYSIRNIDKSWWIEI